MKKVFTVIITISFISQIISCDKKEDDLISKIDNYPMTVGTEWIYDNQVIEKKFESETSDIPIDIDTMDFTERVWIDKDTLLNDTMNVKVFKTYFSDGLTLTEYKSIDSEGLKTYAYLYSLEANVLAKTSCNIMKNTDLYFNCTFKNGEMIGNDIYVFKTPLLDVKLPLNINSSWICVHPTDTKAVQIDKSVIDSEKISLIGQSFDCFKIDWNYNGDQLYDGTTVTEWISEKGLIKRVIINRFTYDYPDSVYFEQTRTLTLRELSIK